MGGLVSVEVRILKAFIKDKQGGNPAGIVVNERHLRNKDKQEIARIVGLSETVFINALKDNIFDVSFFTPNKEVDLCGHGTIAAFQCLLEEESIEPGDYYQVTKAGKLKVLINHQKEILMEQRQPFFGDIIGNKKEIANSLGIEVKDLHQDLPIQIVSTGLKDLIVGVKNHSVLNTLRPDFNKISMISEKNQVSGYHVFSLESFNEESANCRNFAPYYAIDEESATGTASGALASYLFYHNVISKKKSKKIIFYQGENMGNHSEIHVKLETADNKIVKVFVGGQAGLDGIKTIDKY